MQTGSYVLYLKEHKRQCSRVGNYIVVTSRQGFFKEMRSYLLRLHVPAGVKIMTMVT